MYTESNSIYNDCIALCPNEREKDSSILNKPTAIGKVYLRKFFRVRYLCAAYLSTGMARIGVGERRGGIIVMILKTGLERQMPFRR